MEEKMLLNNKYELIIKTKENILMFLQNYLKKLYFLI